MSPAGASRRPRKKALVTGAAVIAAAALAAGIVLPQVFGPERVDPATVHVTPHAQQVPANKPVVAAPKAADLTASDDITDQFTTDFAGNIMDVRSRVQNKQVPTPAVSSDACLLDWAKQNLARLAPKGTYEVIDVCGRPTAVLAGPSSADAKVLAYGALERSAPAGMKALLGESDSNRLAFVAVRTTEPQPEDQAQLMAAAVLEK